MYNGIAELINLMTSAKYQVLARRYRPQKFCEVVGQESAVTTLKNALRFDKAAHAYLFCGSRGVGKTTLARLFAKALNCLERESDMEPCNRCSSCLEIGTSQSLDVIEIDGASNRGIDDIRQINETALYSPSAGRYKIYIIDEVHMLTKEAFNALLKTLEEPPGKAKFFFATTEPHKVLPTIISRCQRFDLGRIQLSQIIGKLEEIARDLGRTAEPEALHLIAAFSDGSLRDAESLFDQILCFAEGTVTASIIRTSLGLIPQEHFFSLDQAFSEARAAFAFELVETLFSAGKDLAHFYEQLIEHVRNLSSARLLGEKSLSLSPDLTARYLQSSRLYASSQCLYLLEYLLRAESQLQKSACQRVALEAILLHYIQSKHRIPMEILVRRLTEMEEALKSQPGIFSAHSEEKNPKMLPQPLEPRTDAKESESQQNQNPVLGQVLKPASKPEMVARREFPALETNPVELPSVESPPQQKSATPSVILKPTPFNPFKPQAETRAPILFPPMKSEASTMSQTAMPASLDPAPSTAQAKEMPVHLENLARYDTLMRFAAVELEGTFRSC